MARPRFVRGFVAVALCIAALCVQDAQSCTLIAAGKKATVDGSVLVAHTDDAGAGTADIRLIRVPPMDHPEGAVRNIYKTHTAFPRYSVDDRGPGYKPQNGEALMKPLGHVPQVRHTYGYIDQDYGLINEHQLVIAETTTSARTAGWPLDKSWGKCLFSIGELSKIAMERCDTARCAIKTMGELAEKYGFYSDDVGDDPNNPAFMDTSETLAIGDKEGEVWMFHILTDIDNSGAIWAAQRVPDDEVTVAANGFRIRHMNLSDSDNFLASKNVVESAKKAGWYDPDKDGEFDFMAAYVHDGTPNPLWPLYVGRREWRVFNMLNPDLKLNPNLGTVAKRPAYPFSIKPAKKIHVKHIFQVFRDHYEGTEFDLTKGMGAGPFHTPVRYDGNARLSQQQLGGWERAISMYRTIFSFVAQARGDMPDVLGGRVWFGLDAPHGTVYVPIYGSQETIPKAYAIGHETEFDSQAAFWAFSFVNNLSMLKFDYMSKDIQAEQKRLEDLAFQSTAKWEQQAKMQCADEKCNGSDAKRARDMLTNFTQGFVDQVMDAWWKLATKLIVKYRSGCITKSEGETGSRAPGYPKEWLEKTEFWGWPGKHWVPFDPKKQNYTIVPDEVLYDYNPENPQPYLEDFDESTATMEAGVSDYTGNSIFSAVSNGNSEGGMNTNTNNSEPTSSTSALSQILTFIGGGFVACVAMALYRRLPRQNYLSIA